jgi:cardiolipin synthase A/B
LVAFCKSFFARALSPELFFGVPPANLMSVSPRVVEILVPVAHVLVALVVSAHIILTKDDVRSAIGWTGLVWLTPFVGAILYVALGVNRIDRAVGAMRHRPVLADAERAEQVRNAMLGPADPCLPTAIQASLAPVARLVGTVTHLPLAAGCSVEPLLNGDAAYPAMLAAIDGATRTVALASYIFDRGEVGTKFVDALARAVGRGVAVRVLIDGVGARYSHPPIVEELKRRGVPVARFLPALRPVPSLYFNLRNHRKMMIVDGAIGFCGGLNIRDDCVIALHRPSATQDLHFRIRGPVVPQIMHAFAFDWHFTTGETLPDAVWSAPERCVVAGDIVCRGIADGPDADFETLLMTIMGAIAQARTSVRLATPYFLPDAPLINALRVAALRGVNVEIVLPEHGNLKLVEWAMVAQLPQVLAWGCRVHLTRPPFDHTKLMVVDGAWSLIGSCNLDPRSLRLNFEYNVECYSTALAATLGRILDDKIAAGRVLTLDELERLPLWRRLRNGAVWLAQPYL